MGMKRRDGGARGACLAGVLGMLLLLLVPMAHAEDDLRIGVVDVSALFQQAPQAQTANFRLQQEFGQREQELVAKQQELQEKQERLENEGDLMSAGQRQELEQEAQNLRRQLRRSQEAFQEDVNVRRNEELSRVQRQIFAIIEDMAESEGFDVILGENVIYAADTVDITPEVLERLEQENEE